MTVDITEKQEIVYLYTFPNGKYYVGKTCEPDSRCLNYKNYTKKQPIYKALKKAEENGDTVDLTYLSEYVSNKAAAGIEKHYIALYRTNICRYGPDFGYNCTDGGEGVSGYKFTEETKAKISAAAKKNWQDPEYKARHKAGVKEAMNTPEVKARHKAAHNTPEFKAKHSAVLAAAFNKPEARASNSARSLVAQNKHENRIRASLTTQLYYHEKRLEAAGLIPKMV